MEERTLTDKVVVITGASSGFGKGVARKFAESGSRVVLAARRAELLDELATECEAAGGRALPVPTDVSKQDDIETLMRATLDTFGRVDIWINNAGVGALGRFEKVPLPDHVQVIATTLLGTVYGSYFAYRWFVEQGHGTLINIASELGRHTVPYYSSYTAAKHGVVGLGETLNQEIAQNDIENVHVCTVMPTAHDTPFFDHVANYTGHEVQAPAPLHDPHNVVETIMRLAVDPKDEKIVGADGIAKVILKNLAPDLQEKLAAMQIHRSQIEKAPPAPDSPGAVRAPTARGTEVSAGRLNT
jgi:short-subunit dehydrogenase